MCDIVCMAVDTTHTDPIMNQRVFKRGDPVAVLPTGTDLGTLVTLPPAQGGKFAVVRLLRDDDVTPVWSIGDPIPTRLERVLTESWTDDISGDPEYADVVRYRIWRVLVDNLPIAVRQQLNQTGLYEVRWTQVRAYVQNQLTLADATSEDA